MFQSICRMNCYMLSGLIALTETLDMLLLTAYVCQNLFTAESDAKLAVRCWHIKIDWLQLFLFYIYFSLSLDYFIS